MSLPNILKKKLCNDIVNTSPTFSPGIEGERRQLYFSAWDRRMKQTCFENLLNLSNLYFVFKIDCSIILIHDKIHKIGRQKNFLNLIKKSIYKRPTANITLMMKY